ncbi:hypothetical protein SH611_03145 [Geminicoccaceae bacterium 1502E]|nr:hypothetical protein [Geminicoccaceae bacterium 1502E]
MTRREFVERAEALGYEVCFTAGGHLKLTHPCGALVHASSTPSDCRSWANTEAQLRRELRRHGCEPAPPPAPDPKPKRATRPARPGTPRKASDAAPRPDRLVEITGPDGRRIMRGYLAGRRVQLVRRPAGDGAFEWRPGG